MLARKIQPIRRVTHRTQANTGGPIARLVSPSDLGELIKPFVFLDRFDFDGQAAPMSMEHGWHPHSGIATVTVVFEGAIRFAETTGKAGVLPAGSVAPPKGFPLVRPASIVKIRCTITGMLMFCRQLSKKPP